MNNVVTGVPVMCVCVRHERLQLFSQQPQAPPSSPSPGSSGHPPIPPSMTYRLWSPSIPLHLLAPLLILLALHLDLQKPKALPSFPSPSSICDHKEPKSHQLYLLATTCSRLLAYRSKSCLPWPLTCPSPALILQWKLSQTMQIYVVRKKLR